MTPRKRAATDERLVELTKLCKCGRPLGFHGFSKPHMVCDDQGGVLCAGFKEAK
jgi:hypothetical protein